MKPAGVIFDMDGLMLDTEQLEIGFYVRISAEMGWPTEEAFLRSSVGMGMAVTEEYYKAEFGAEYPFQEIWKRVKEAETEFGNREGLPHKPGLLVLLEKLKSLGIPLAVATSTGRDMADWKLSSARIREYFAILACGDEVKQGKPEPDVFLLAASRLGFDPASCIGFEDSPAGLTGLAKAGIPSVFVKDLVEPPQEILDTVWKRCNDLAEAAELFN
jgi:HAD superfamily hydrolase (TIGR01509 family)